MLRRYWRLIATVGFLTLWPDAAIAQDIGNQPPADASARQAATEAADDVGKAGPTWGQFIAFTGEQHSGDDCDDACQRDKDDLQAQQNMANAAWAMVIATAASIIVTVGSLWLIWRTLYWSKETFREARNTTYLTGLAVEATREASVNQVRAYLGIVKVEASTSLARHRGEAPGTGSDSLWVEVNVHNGGLTPAKNIEALVVLYRRVGVADKKLVKRSGFETNDMMPNDGRRIFGERIDLRASDVAILDGCKDVAFVLKGRVRYSTVVQAKKRTLSFAYHLVGDPFSTNPAIIRLKQGNQSD